MLLLHARVHVAAFFGMRQSGKRIHINANRKHASAHRPVKNAVAVAAQVHRTGFCLDILGEMQQVRICLKPHQIVS